VGAVTVRDVQTVPNALWASRQVADVMQTAVDQLIVGPDISTMQAMEMMVTRGADQLIVVQDDLVLGLLTRASIGQFIELHQPRR
jgi:predicted transcriptional regulator